MIRLGESVHERLEERCELIKGNTIFIDFSKFRDEDVSDLETDSLRTEAISEQFVEDALKPGDGLSLITS